MMTAIAIFFFVTIGAYAFTAAGMSRRRKELGRRLENSVLDNSDDEKNVIKPERKSIFAAIDVSIRNISLSSAIKRELARANWSLKVSEFILITILAGSLIPLLALLITGNNTLTITLVCAGAVFPYAYMKRRQAARKKLFAGQLLDAVTLISNSLKSGYSFLQSIDLVARELPPPICEEFQKVLQEIKLGIPFEEAVGRLISRVENDDLDLVMTSVNIQREVGGNLSEVLDKIAHTIRERIRIKGQIQTLTAQGRLSGLILSVMPLALGLFLFMINPDYISMLFTRMVGKMMIVVAIVTQTIGMFLIKKIINIRV